MEHITFDDLKNEVMIAMENKPKQWRKGQFVFNYIDEVYGIARHVQFVDNVDCFYLDDQIDSFLRCVVDRYNYLVDCQEKN
jgi:hypothetical protein